MGSPIKKALSTKKHISIKLRLLFWQALCVPSCDRAGGSDTASVCENLVLLAPWLKTGKLNGSKCRRIVWFLPRARYFVRCVVSITETHPSPIWLKAEGERPALRPPPFPALGALLTGLEDLGVRKRGQFGCDFYPRRRANALVWTTIGGPFRDENRLRVRLSDTPCVQRKRYGTRSVQLKGAIIMNACCEPEDVS
jgi:hypothetical protein